MKTILYSHTSSREITGIQKVGILDVTKQCLSTKKYLPPRAYNTEVGIFQDMTDEKEFSVRGLLLQIL